MQRSGAILFARPELQKVDGEDRSQKLVLKRARLMPSRMDYQTPIISYSSRLSAAHAERSSGTELSPCLVP